MNLGLTALRIGNFIVQAATAASLLLLETGGSDTLLLEDGNDLELN